MKPAYFVCPAAWIRIPSSIRRRRAWSPRPSSTLQRSRPSSPFRGRDREVRSLARQRPLPHPQPASAGRGPPQRDGHRSSRATPGPLGRSLPRAPRGRERSAGLRPTWSRWLLSSASPGREKDRSAGNWPTSLPGTPRAGYQ